MINIRIGKTTIVVAKLMISAILLYFLFGKIDFKQLLGTIQNVNVLFLIAAIIAFIISKIISSVRLTYFLKSADIPISQWHNLKLYWLGMYYNLFLPGGIGGDGYKIYYLKRKFRGNTKKVFWAILVDRVTGVVALSTLCFIIFFFLPLSFAISKVLLLSIPLIPVLFYFFIKTSAKQFADAFFTTGLLSFGVQILQLIAVVFILLALKHYTAFTGYLFLFLISSIVAVIPFTIGGIGSREITFFIGAEWLHLNINLAVTISLLFFSITALVSFAGIYYSFMPLEQEKNTVLT